MAEYILINKDAVKIEDLFIDQGFVLQKFFDRIYTIDIDGKKLDWLVKTYDKEKYAKIENSNLTKLKDIAGVPVVLDAGFSKQFNYLIISRIKGEDLYDFVDKHGAMTEKNAQTIIKQLLRIIHEMHKRKVIHKDIKPENIIYNHISGDVSLIDFEGKQTEDYSSPEQLNRQRLSEKTDIWSTGATLYFLLTRHTPFPKKKDVLYGILKFSRRWSSNLKDFLGCLLEREVSLRYTAEEALEHAWLTK